ncbi:glycosyltransferase [Lentisphaera profundi]|uniref:Glycosyltransferase n=1 Tax=Lentisphaera profundi TaxID=1658616 RepID=A0ABY7VYB5_9BACT|nr:glycosyltransferase [Lentisphaera profundi]WDE98200.1 glycosyltransferase [Lentisphaera profundi]
MLISVIIPCFNVEDYIQECLESVYQQTYVNLEVICIDNKSSDTTWAKLQELKNTYPTLILEEEIKPGAPAARNKGLALAKGEWIQFLDADDLLLQDKLTHQMSLIKTETNMIVATSFRRNTNGHEKSMSINRDAWLGLFSTSLGITSANLWKKDLLVEVNGWNDSLKSSQEYNLMFRCLQNDANICFDDKPLTIIRERESGQISQSNPGPKWIRYIELRKNILSYLKENNPVIIKENNTFFQQRLFNAIRTLYPHAPQRAISFHHELIDKKFRPSVDGTNTKNYILMYNILGFRLTEKIKSLFK